MTSYRPYFRGEYGYLHLTEVVGDVQRAACIGDSARLSSLVALSRADKEDK